MARPVGCRMPVVTRGRRLVPSIQEVSIFGAVPASAQNMRPSCGSTTTDVGDSRPVLMIDRRYRPSVLATITRPRGFEPERSVSVQYRFFATQSTDRLVGLELPVQKECLSIITITGWLFGISGNYMQHCSILHTSIS